MRCDRAFGVSSIVIVTLAVPAVTNRARAQLFENLEALGNRLDAGDPAVKAAGRREGPKGIAVGDLDRNGWPDIAASNLDATVTVYLNVGQGEFSEPRHLGTGARTLRQVIVEDLTGNGWPDVASAAPYDQALYLFENQGGGKLAAASLIPAWRGARNLAAGDFDGDGTLEIALAGPGLGLRQYRRNATGIFEPVADLRELDAGVDRFPKPVYSLKVLRRNGVARDELVVTHARSGRVWILAAGDTAGLKVQGSVSIVDPELVPPDKGIIVCGDEGACLHGVYSLDVGPIAEPAATGRPDLVTAHRNLGTVQVRTGTEGTARFEETIHQKFHIPGGPRAVRILDLDGDGWNDLAVVLRNLDRVITYRNEGGTLVPSTEMPVGQSPREVAAADFNFDGQPDLGVINRVSSDISILTGYPGQVGFGGLDQVYLVDGEVVSLTVFDFNKDGRDDVIQLHRASGDLSVRLAGPGGVLEPPVFYPMGTLPTGQAIVDVNNDGNPDAVTVNLGNERGWVSVRLGDGEGNLGEERRYEIPSEVEGAQTWGGRLFALEVADFDNDQNLDLAVGFFDCRLGFFRGLGDGSFEFTQAQFFVFEGRAMAAGDFDQDGDIDLAAGSYTGDVVVLENRGDMMTSSVFHRTEYESPSEDKFGTEDMKTVDINDDGDLDLVVASGNGVMIFLGRKGMGFVLYLSILPGTNFPASSLALADFDGDGDRDIAVACQILSCVTMLTRNGNGSYVPALTVDVPAGRLIASGDLDGDGQPDLVGSGEVLWAALSSRRVEPSEPPELEGERAVIPHPVINELLAINNKFPVTVDNGRTSDWVEIFNGTGTTVSLNGWSLFLERPSGSAKYYRIPREAQIESGGHLLVLFSRNPSDYSYNTGFKLTGAGGRLSLRAPNGRYVDRVEYPPQRENVSYARYRDGLEAFVFNPYPSPGESNTDNGPIEPLLELESAAPGLSTFEEPLRAVSPGEAIRFFATGSDDVGIVSVSVLYRRLDVPDPQSHRLLLYDDGMHGDEDLQDGLYSAVLNSGLPSGAEIRFYLEARDLSENLITVPDGAAFAADRDGRNLYSLAVGADVPSLQISEFVASNTTGIQDQVGNFPDWVEIRNCGTSTVPLRRILLGETFPADENWFEFPAGMSLAPGEHLVVFCDGDPEEGPLHAPFNLDAFQGGRLVLVATAPHGGHALIDSVGYGVQLSNVAWARSSCGGAWRAAEPTPGQPNSGTAARGDADASGQLDITDAIVILNYLFQGGRLACPAAANANGDRLIDVSDSIFLLVHLFIGGQAPAGDEVECHPLVEQEPAQ